MVLLGSRVSKGARETTRALRRRIEMNYPKWFSFLGDQLQQYTLSKGTEIPSFVTISLASPSQANRDPPAIPSKIYRAPRLFLCFLQPQIASCDPVYIFWCWDRMSDWRNWRLSKLRSLSIHLIRTIVRKHSYSRVSKVFVGNPGHIKRAIPEVRLAARACMPSNETLRLEDRLGRSDRQ